MTGGIRDAAARAYGSRWTAGLIAFELIGAALVGLHSRTTALWPLLSWLGCAPFVRFVYLRKLHDAGPIEWLRAVRRAYAVTAWLVLAGVGIAAPALGLFGVVRHLAEVLAFCGRHAGYAGVVAGTLGLAASLVAVVGALAVWGGLATIAYAKAVVDPARRSREAIVYGIVCVWRRAPLVIGMTAFQGVLTAYAVGAQLLKPSGIALMPMVWPAVFFAPVALAFLLALTESAPDRGADGGVRAMRGSA